MSQSTYQRSKLLIQVNDVARTESLCSWIISLANAKSLIKINFEHIIFICQPIYKMFAAYYDKFSSKYCLENILPPSKLNINYLLVPKSKHYFIFFQVFIFFYFYKGLKGAASTPTNDIVTPVGMSESITLWHFKPHLLILTFTRAVSSPRLLDPGLEIGIHLQILRVLSAAERCRRLCC